MRACMHQPCDQLITLRVTFVSSFKVLHKTTTSLLQTSTLKKMALRRAVFVLLQGFGHFNLGSICRCGRSPTPHANVAQKQIKALKAKQRVEQKLRKLVGHFSLAWHKFYLKVIQVVFPFNLSHHQTSVNLPAAHVLKCNV